MLITKREEVIKQGFCKILGRKLRPRGSPLLEFIHSSGWGRGERLFEFDWEEEGVGASIRGWALIRINTVGPTDKRKTTAFLESRFAQASSTNYQSYQAKRVQFENNRYCFLL